MTSGNTFWQTASHIRIQTHILILQNYNTTTYSNSNKAELIVESLRNQFSLNQDVENRSDLSHGIHSQ